MLIEGVINLDEILKKIDEIKSRMNVTYHEAKEALEKNQGDVLAAIVYLERHESAGRTMEQGKNILHGLQGILGKSKETKIQVLKEGRPVAEVPAAAGVLGLVGALAIPGAAVVGVLGSVAAMMNKYSLTIQKNGASEEEPQEGQNEIDNQV